MARSLNPLAKLFLGSVVLILLFGAGRSLWRATKGSTASSSSSAANIKSMSKQGGIGLLTLRGAIMTSGRTLHDLDALLEDSKVKGVLLRLDSPGGSVAPSQEIYEAVKRAEKPVYVSMASLAASGAYYIAAGADKVFAHAGTLTGSIGVIMFFENFRKLAEWAKMDFTAIKTGKFKDAGAPYKEMTPDDRQYFQEVVDQTLVQFKKAIEDGRKMTPAEVTAVADGRIFTGERAKQLKLVDEIGTTDDALLALAKEVGISGKPEIIRVHRERPWLRQMLEGDATDTYDDEYDAESASSLFSLPSAGTNTNSLIESVLRRSPLRETRAGIYAIWPAALPETR